jgi:hypothetical protein
MRKVLLPLVALTVGSGLFFASCEKETSGYEDMTNGKEFMPLEIGRYILYDVDSVIWDDFLRAEIHHHSQQRYEVVDTFRDDANRLSYVINVLSRPSAQFPFKPDNVIHVTPTETTMEYKQRNINFIKLIFPVENGRAWDGNAKIPLGDADYEEYNNPKWKYEYSKLGESFDPGNNFYQNSVTVNHIDDQLNDPDVDTTAYAYKNYSQEVYAYNVGMVYRQRTYWVFQPSAGSAGGGSGFRKGYEVTMRAVDNN